jgi:hypothetical protein
MDPRTIENADELRVMGLIAFVSLLVGTAIGIFDARLWLYDSDSTYVNVLTYAMGAFTLQGMSYFIYKMLMQDSMDHRASFAKAQKDRSRRMLTMQSEFQQKQMEAEMHLQQIQLHKQLEMMQGNPEAYFNSPLYGGEPMTILPPTHDAEVKQPVSLGAIEVVEKAVTEEKTSVRNADGTFKTKKQS